MKTFILSMLLAVFLALVVGCTSPNDAYRALGNSGYSDIQITGYKFFACAKDDWNHTGFIAKNPQGKVVEGVVCSGLIFKNATIRF